MENLKFNKLNENSTANCDICWEAYENGECQSDNVLQAAFEVVVREEKRDGYTYEKKIKCCEYGCYDWLKIASQEEIEAYL